ncbi:hypothetical protein KFE98_17110 [bacterium SCSIO 12741]|nr:hypothetical protein KFE98_17110 [bacterium SCSIO 12741]
MTRPLSSLISLLFLLLFFQSSITAQEVKGMRYSISYSAIEKWAQDNPEIAAGIMSKMPERMPYWCDQYQVDSLFYQVFWKSNSELMSIKIHSVKDRSVYVLLPDNSLRKESENPGLDSVKFEPLENPFIDGEDTLTGLKLIDHNALPVWIYDSEDLPTEAVIKVDGGINDYPEVLFPMMFNRYPQRIKIEMLFVNSSFRAEQDLSSKDAKLYFVLSSLSESIKSKTNRRILLNGIVDYKP